MFFMYVLVVTSSTLKLATDHLDFATCLKYPILLPHSCHRVPTVTWVSSLHGVFFPVTVFARQTHPARLEQLRESQPLNNALSQGRIPQTHPATGWLGVVFPKLGPRSLCYPFQNVWLGFAEGSVMSSSPLELHSNPEWPLSCSILKILAMLRQSPAVTFTL